MSTPTQNQKPDISKTDSKDNVAKLNVKIKETWGKMSDDDVKLYEGNRDQFISKLKEKESVSKEDAEKKLQELEKACGCSAKAA